MDERKIKYQNIFNLYRTNDLESAKEKGLVFLKEYPQDFQILNLLGAISVRTENLDDAVNFFKKALEIDNTYTKAYNNLGLVYRSLNNFKDAQICFEKCIFLKKDYKEAYNNLGITQKDLGLQKDAMVSLNKSLEIDNTYDQALYNIGNIYSEEENLKEALVYYKRCLDSNPNHYDCLINIANTLTKLNKIDESIQYLEKAISINPSNYAAFFNIANTYYSRGNLKIASSKYEEALKRNPNHQETYIRLGIIEKEFGNRKKAKDYFKQSYLINDNHPQSNYQLGMLYHEDQIDSEAVKYFDKCTEYDAQERALVSHYRLQNYDIIKNAISNSSNIKRDSRIIASVANHFSYNFDQVNEYTFCPDPLKFIYQKKISELIDGSKLKNNLISLINKVDVDNRLSGVVKGGVQSTGNLLRRKENEFIALADLVQNEIKKFLKSFTNCNDLFIQNFPKDPVIQNSWFIKLQKGGHLTPHIHHLGWMSGAVYLKIPKQINNPHEGSFIAGINGDNYPKNKDKYPEKIIDVEEGDIVLFPSCLFHRTVPFNSEEERICIAFDVGIKDKIFF